MRCPNCRARNLVEIGLVLNAARVTMHSCPTCENRWWEREGEQVAVDRVLAMASH